MGEVDPAFVQEIDQRPKLKLTIPVDDDIPIIDLSSVLSSSHGDTKQFVSEIGYACQKRGFFQVVNHGVPLDLVKKMDVGKRFFELPVDEKKKVKGDMVNAMGYHDGENTKNVRYWKEVFYFLVEDMAMIPASPDPDDSELRILTNQWPQYPPQFR